MDRTPDNPPEGCNPNADVPEVAPVALHDDMESKQMHPSATESPPTAEPEHEIACVPDNPLGRAQRNPGLPEMAPVTVHNGMESGEIPARVLEAHLSVEPEQKIDPTPDNPLEGEANPGLPDMAPPPPA